MVRKYLKDSNCKAPIKGIANESYDRESEDLLNMQHKNSEIKGDEKKANSNKLKSVSLITLVKQDIHTQAYKCFLCIRMCQCV